MRQMRLGTRRSLGVRSGLNARARELSGLVASFLIFASAAFASEQNDVVVHAEYLPTSTDWCPAENGVPFVGTVTGPKLIRGPFDQDGKNRGTVRIRRALSVSEHAITTSQPSPPPSESAYEEIGAFSANFRGCQNPWLSPKVSGTWKVSGAEEDSGAFDDIYLATLTIWREGLVGPPSKTIGTRTFYASGPFSRTTTQSYAFATDKEQSQ